MRGVWHPSLAVGLGAAAHSVEASLVTRTQPAWSLASKSNASLATCSAILISFKYLVVSTLDGNDWRGNRRLCTRRTVRRDERPRASTT